MKKLDKNKKHLTNFRNRMIKASRYEDFSIKEFSINNIDKVVYMIYGILILYSLSNEDPYFRNYYHLPRVPVKSFMIVCAIVIIIQLVLLWWFKYLINDCNNYKKNEMIRTNTITNAYIEEHIEEYKFQKNEHLELLVFALIALVIDTLFSL